MNGSDVGEEGVDGSTSTKTISSGFRKPQMMVLEKSKVQIVEMGEMIDLMSTGLR
jgi:hypothetical protein